MSPSLTADASRPPDTLRLAKQAQDISVLLADAGVEACPLPEGVRRLRDRAEAAEASLAALTQAQEAILSDAIELRSALGFMWMRMTVAESVDDAYTVAKQEFETHEAAFKRSEISFPKALAALRASLAMPQNENHETLSRGDKGTLSEGTGSTASPNGDKWV